MEKSLNRSIHVKIENRRKRCQVLNVQHNWQIVNTNLSRYRSQSLQVLLDNAQGDSSQDSRTYKLQEEDFIFCLVRSIEEQARLIENRICRILSRPKQQLKSIKETLCHVFEVEESEIRVPLMPFLVLGFCTQTSLKSWLLKSCIVTHIFCFV